MIPEYLSALGNHLWQSTLFGAAAYGLALVLKGNRPAVRYRLWMAVSLKFLVPFGLLVSLGRQIEWSSPAVEQHPALISALEGFSEPFASEPPAASTSMAPQPLASVRPSSPAIDSRLPMIVVGVWLCGAIVTLFLWLREWFRIRRFLRDAVPVDLHLPGMPVPVMMTASTAEPGIVGILRPVLLLPKGLLERLSPAQIDAVVSHELCHVRRRDNLFASIHMIVETVFWFHPLVWWIERRLVEERERACDEEVLQRGGEPEAYAEGILNVCKFYKESALVCVSGVAGADLRKRVEDIMTNRIANKLSLARMALLFLAAVAVFVGPIAIGVGQAGARQVESPYTFATIDVPGSSLTVATGIDTVGRVVGYYSDDRGTHGFLLGGSALSTIDYPGAAWTAAYGINAAGQIVGAYGPSELTGRHGFLLGGGNFSSFDVPGSTDTVARGLNNRGQIVGDYLGMDGMRHGFLLSGGTYSTVEVPQSGSGVASGITDAGQIAGLAGSGPKWTGFVFANQSYVAVAVPNSNYTEILGINNLGDIVGQMDGPRPPSRAFRRSGSSFSIIEIPEYPASADARGINDLGQIVGAFTAKDGKTRGYRATPTALRLGPPDTQAVTHLTDLTPGTNVRGPGPAPATRPGTQGPQGPPGPTGPAGPPGPAAPARPEPTPAQTLARALDNMHNRVGNASSAIQKSVPYRNATEMGKALEKAVAALAVVTEDLVAAQSYLKDHPENARASSPAITEINFEAPVPGGTAGPNVPPAVAVGLNNLKAGYAALTGASGGDLGGLRDKIGSDLAVSVEAIYASLGKADTIRGGRGRGRGEQ
jgi:probable HAF family extracellular repeat protein